MDNLTPRRPSIVDAADDLRKEWRENGTGPYAAPAVPEGVDTAELPSLPRAAMLTGRNLENLSIWFSQSQMREFGAQQREAGRREGAATPLEMHRIERDRAEKAEAALATRQSVTAQLDAMRSAFHQNMLRAFPEKSHAEIDAEITRATGVAGPVSALMDEQIIAIQRIVDRLNEDGMPNTADELCALLAASPKVEPEPDLRAEFNELQFNAQRLRNVVTLLGMENEVPQSNAGLDGARGAVLGQIAAKLRAKVEPTIENAGDLSKLVRYDAVAVQNNGYDWGVEMRSADDGRFVEFDDVQALSSKVEPVSDDKRDAERMRKLRSHRGTMLLTGFFGNGCVNRTLSEVDAVIDAISATPPQPKPETKP